MRFDWYAATIPADPAVVVETLGKAGHEVRPCDSLARTYHYRFGVEIHHRDKGVLSKVFWKDGMRPYAFASSDMTDQFVEIVRESWPDHFVTRVDAAEDFHDPTARKAIPRHMRRIGKARGMRMEEIKSPINKRQGSTTYLGSRTSEYRARAYDKGWEQLAKIHTQLGRIGVRDDSLPANIEISLPDGSTVNAANWYRLELQARPDREDAKLLLATATPEQVWAVSDWSRELAQAVFSLELQKIYAKTRRMSEDDEKIRWMLTQYAGPMRRIYEALGKDAATLGVHLVNVMEELALEKAELDRIGLTTQCTFQKFVAVGGNKQQGTPGGICVRWAHGS